MLNEYLLKLGLTQTEIDIYLLVLRSERIAPALVSRKTGIKRPTVYAACAELVRKGLIGEDDLKKVKYFFARPPIEIEEYLHKEKKKILEKEDIAQKAMLELEKLPKTKSFFTPDVRFVDGLDTEDFLYRQQPKWVQSMKKSNQTTWWGFQDKDFLKNKQFLKWIDFHWKNAEGTDLKLLTNDSKIEQKMAKEKLYKDRQIKFWKESEFTATQWVIGEYVINLVESEKQNYLVQIKDKVLANNLRNLFRVLWNKV